MLSVLLDEQPGGRAMTGQVIRRVDGLKQWLAGGVLALAAHAAFAQVPGLPPDVVKAWKASKLPEDRELGMGFDLQHYWDGQPVRYFCKDASTGTVFFVVE